MLEWDRPFVGRLGDLWTLKLHTDAAAYNATDMNQQPNFANVDNVDDARALPEAALDFRWPFARYSDPWGTQVIEPLAELVTGPNEGDSQVNKYPNEDSFDWNLTDQNLFGFNRLGGIDRLEGGSRATVGLHTAWYLGGATLDGMVGQSYRTTTLTWLPEVSGLRDNVSDIVGHLSFTPTSWFDTTYRFRFDHRSWANRELDVTASVGKPIFARDSRISLYQFRSILLLCPGKLIVYQPSTCWLAFLYAAQRNHPECVLHLGPIPHLRLRPARPGAQSNGGGRR